MGAEDRDEEFTGVASEDMGDDELDLDDDEV
jgi:hypothetical protein